MVMKDSTPSMDKIRFTPDTLYATEREELVDFAQEQFAMLFDVVHLAKVSNSLGAKVTTIGKTTRATVYATSSIHATLSEVRDIFFSEHTQFATGFAQSQEIHALLTPSNKHPMRSAALRWSLWETPSKMVRKRDIVYVEYMDAFVTKDGRNGWARCTHSIEHRSCPALTHSHNIVRAHMYCSGTLYTETDEPGVLDVVTLFDVDTRGIPAWMSKMIALRKAQSAANVEHLIRLSRVMTDEDDPEVKMIEFHVKGKVCRGCGDRVSKWSSTRKCRDCKEPLCKTCSEVVYYHADERKKLKQICVYCVDDVITDQEQRGDVSNLGLDVINEHFPHVPRRMHHMSFRSLRRTREINYSLSPTASEQQSLSYTSSRLSSSASHASLSRRRSDPGMSLQSFARSHTSSSSLRSASSIAA